jgi:hypothetical protein
VGVTGEENPCPSPLDHLVSGLAECANTLQRSGLVRRGEGPDDPSQPVRACDEIEQLRQPAKDIVVWLELRGRDADAAEVDDALAELCGVAQQYDEGQLQPQFFADADEPETPLDQLTSAASTAAARLEDLSQEIPDDVWQGFGDA